MEYLKILLFSIDLNFSKILEKDIKKIKPEAIINFTYSWEELCKGIKSKKFHVVITSKKVLPNIATDLSHFISALEEDDRPLGVLMLAERPSDDEVQTNFSASCFVPYISMAPEISYEEELELFLENKSEYLKRNQKAYRRAQLRKRIHFPISGDQSLDIHLKCLDEDFEIITKVENLSIHGVGVVSKKLHRKDLVGKNYEIVITLETQSFLTINAIQKHTGTDKKPFSGFQFVDVNGASEKKLIEFFKNL